MGLHSVAALVARACTGGNPPPQPFSIRDTRAALMRDRPVISRSTG